MKDQENPTKLTTNHLRQLKGVTQEIRRDIAEARLDREDIPRDILEKMGGDGLWWAWLYDLSQIQHQWLFFYFLGLNEEIRAALDAADDRVQVFLNLARNYELDEKELESLLNGEANAGRRKLVLCMLLAQLRQFDCLKRRSDA